jgi:hypothetical protein
VRIDVWNNSERKLLYIKERRNVSFPLTFPPFSPKMNFKKARNSKQAGED